MYDRDLGLPADTDTTATAAKMVQFLRDLANLIDLDTRRAQTLTGVEGTLFERLNGCGPDDVTITMVVTDGATGVGVRDVLSSYGLLDG